MISTENYEWKQTLADVSLLIKLEKGVKSRDIKVSFTVTHLKVAVQGVVVLEGELSKRIIPDESTWLLDSNELQIELAKQIKQVIDDC
jgi:hypothetical protein